MIFAKYSFPEGIWETLKPIIQQDEQYINCAVVEIGHICISSDTGGNCTQFDPNFAVDIMWYGEIPEEFNQYEVFPNPVGVHIFAGCEAIYLERLCRLNPNSPFCNPKP